MKKPLTIAVMIPVYNDNFYLTRALKALAKQTRMPDEVIVVDNNSSAGKEAKLVTSKFSFVTLLQQSEQGIVFARNTGFDAAISYILVKIDADTEPDPDFIQTYLDIFEDDEVDAASGYVYTKEGRSAVRWMVALIFNGLAFRSNRLISGHKFILGCNLALRNTAWDKIKPGLLMRNDIWEDLDMSVQLNQARLRVEIIRQKKAAISIRSANTSPLRLYKRLFGATRVYLAHKKYISVILSLIVVHISFAAWAVSSLVGLVGFNAKKRPRPEQY